MAVSNFNIDFPAATSDWGTITSVGLYDEKGERLLDFALERGTTINAGDTLNFSGDISFAGGGASPCAVSSGGRGGAGHTGTYIYNYNATYPKTEEETMMTDVCQFCGEDKVRELTERKLVKGMWEIRITYYYKCGTSKTAGDYKVKKPRVRVSKGCVGFKK